jgi:DNA-binding MarR family transcriptional regulator
VSSSTSHEKPRQTLGALLRLSYQEYVRQSFADESVHTYSQIRPAHTVVLQPLHFHPEGLTATEMADRAGITKQVMGRFIDELEANGYVERIQHPTDRRSHLVRVTPQGRAASEALRSAADRVEAACGSRMGAERMGMLRELLVELNEALHANDESGRR